jgi:hypothetical protein
MLRPDATTLASHLHRQVVGECDSRTEERNLLKARELWESADFGMKHDEVTFQME